MRTGDRQLDYPREHGLETMFVEARDGTRLRVLCAGNPRAPRLLCVHGFPQNAAEWRKLLPLVKDRFRFLALDMRGFAGSSIPTSGDYALATLGADLVSVLEATAGQGAKGSAHLVTHDWGGPVGWALVESRPDLVAHQVCVNAPHYLSYLRQVLSNPTQARGAWYTLLFQVPGIERRLAANGGVAFIRTLRGSSVPGTFSDEDLELYIGPLTDPVRLRACLSYYRAGFRKLLSNRGRAPERPAPTKVPTIIVWGEDDPAVTVSVAEAMKRDVCPDAELRIIRGATHWVPDERPDLVAQALFDGLDRSRRVPDEVRETTGE